MLFSSYMFISMLLSMPILVVSSKSMMIMWIMLEISTITFILLFSSSTLKFMEKFILYFIIQSMASISFLCYMYTNKMSSKELVFLKMLPLIILAIMMKMGLFPTHMWILKVGKFLTWLSLFFMLSWQKIIPIIMFIKTMMMSKFSLIVMPSIIFSTLIQFSILSIKNIILFSSISHTSWSIITNMSTYINMMYFSMYCLIIFMLLVVIMKMNTWNLFTKIKSKMSLMMFLVLVLSGIPPMLGFMLKWIIINTLLHMNDPKMLVFMLLLTATIMFYIYSQMFFNYIFLKKNQMMNNFKMNTHFSTMTPILLIPPIFFIFK